MTNLAEDPLPDWPIELIDATFNVPAGRFIYEDPTGAARVHLDSEDVNFYMECNPLAPAIVVREVLDRVVFPMGLELIPEDECEPETTAAGWTRIYLTPVIPMIPLELQQAADSSVSVISRGKSMFGKVTGLAAQVTLINCAVASGTALASLMEVLWA